MDMKFLDSAKKKILASKDLTIEGLAEKLGRSHSWTSRILSGKGTYRAEYTPIIRKYVGFDDAKGNAMATFDFVALDGKDSLKKSGNVVTQFTLLDGILPANVQAECVKIVAVPSNHCSPEYKSGDYVFVNVNDVMPEPPGTFLIWTGIGYRLQYCQHVMNSEPPLVRMSSKNTDVAYEVEQVELGLAGIAGRVIGRISMSVS